MRNDPLAFLAIEYAQRFIGKPYHWGEAPGAGDDPIFGFDCSGFISEILRATGLFKPSQRETARGILEIFKSETVLDPAPGVLAFFGTDKLPTPISHIAICRDSKFLIEAGGGNSSTVTDQTAAIRNAFVRMRPISYRGDLVVFKDPWQE
jgi:cell wall-associated NlpC family hydrolase